MEQEQMVDETAKKQVIRGDDEGMDDMTTDFDATAGVLRNPQLT